MKIAIFSDTFYPEINGVVTFQLNLIKHLKHKFVLFVPKYPDFMYGEKVKEIKLPSRVIVQRYHSIKLVSNPATRIVTESFRRVEEDFKKFKPDLVHIQTLGIIGLYGQKLAKKYHVPSISTYHTYFPDFMTYLSPVKLLKIDYLLGTLVFKNLKLFSIEIGERLKFHRIKDSIPIDFLILLISFGLKPFKLMTHLTRKSLKAFNDSFVWYVTRKFYDAPDIVTAPSEVMVRTLKEHGVNKPVIYLSNGIELNLFKFKLHHNPNKHVKLIHVGRLGFEKNIDILLKMMKELNKIKKYDFELNIIGDGPARSDLEKLKKELKLNNVNFLGAKPRQELPKYYQEADIFVTASTIETQGIVILEALATGLPVVGARKLAIPDIVKDYVNGLTAEPFNPNDFAEKVLELLTLDFEKLSRNARKSVQEHEIAKAMKNFDELYNTIYKAHKLYSKYIKE